MKDWIKELCPEIAEWQAELIVEHFEQAVLIEREACAKVCELQDMESFGVLPIRAVQITNACAAAIRARSNQ